MAKKAYVYNGSAWEDLASSVSDLSSYATTVDLDDYQLKSVAGLTLVKTQTIGTAVSSVAVSDAFSATYDNYLILVSGGTSSINTTTRFTLGATATGYYWSGAYTSYAGALAGTAGSNTTSFLATSHNANAVSLNVFLSQPNLVKYTLFASEYYGTASGDGTEAIRGFLDDTTSYTAFTLTASSGTYTGGTIYVYGYQK